MKKGFYLVFLIAGLVSGCEKMLLGPEPGNNPEDTFDVLWRVIDEKYALLPLKDVNWDSLYTVYRSRVNPSTTENELWEISGQLIQHLNDGHVWLSNRGCTQTYDSHTLDQAIRSGFSIDLIKNKYLTEIKSTADGWVTYGKIKGTNFGYLYVYSFHGLPTGRDWKGDFDQVIRDLYNTDAIIIDLRNNGGGFTKNDLYFASFFIDHDLTYYYTCMKTGPGDDDFTDPVAWTISTRRDTLQYIKKNVLLTNRFSASGSEAVALIFKNFSYSVQIGDTTNGSFGASLHVAQLPNGWVLYYTSTLTTLPDGTSPEGIGVIPEINVNNTLNDISAGNDKVMEAAVNHLRNSLFP